jgi:alanine-synthesizing transaminase
VRARLEQNLAALGQTVGGACSLLRVDGGWSAVLRVPATRSSEQWSVDLVREAGVLVHPGRFFDFRSEAFLVVSLLTPPGVLEEGLGRLLDFCGGG